MPIRELVRNPTLRPGASDSRPRPHLVLVSAELSSAVGATTSLEEQGFTVTSVADPATALRVLRENRPDLLLVSTELPDADPFSLCRRVVEENLVPAAYCFGPDRDELVERAFDSGATDFLATPFRWA